MLKGKLLSHRNKTTKFKIRIPFKMKKEILLLRLSYWIAALADFAVAYWVLIPQRMGLTEMVYPMGLTATIAFSWGVLLLFADRKPIDRYWILIPTILVIGLLTAVRVIFSHYGMIEFSLVFLLFGIGLIVLMIYSYYYANKVMKNK
jgi:drug/metabolite transporter (DMT)-like permease